MSKILGYGEDAFTLWTLKQHTSDFLESFRDQTAPSDCLIFFRPSLGRSGGEGGAEFGEFDAILASSENVYLIESKWDNFSDFNDEEVTIKSVQKMRHRIFRWYLTRWDPKYSKDWEGFVRDHTPDFQKRFRGKKIAPSDSLLATNLQFILTLLREHCRELGPEHVKDVLLFFYDGERSTPPTRVGEGFRLVCFDYSREVEGNFIALD